MDLNYIEIEHKNCLFSVYLVLGFDWMNWMSCLFFD